MDDEFLKRSTDCVYFLASPLTCKKGIECEYRHSEIARLNPRDCWYWLSGSCLNPGCAFRHPPLDSGAEVTSEVNPSQNQSAATSSKVNVPCYFFFNGTCNKGDRCGFSHGPDDNTPARKSLKTPSTTIDVVSSQLRKNPETNSEPHRDLFQSNSRQVVEVQTRVIVPTKEDLPTNNFTFNIPVQTHEEEGGEPRLKELLRPAPICVNQSPRDLGGDGHIDGEDRLESSPGFDVLVDNESDDIEYEDEQEYVLGLDRGLDGDGRELNGQYVRYDYEEPIEYDPEYPHMGNNSLEDEIRDSYPQINEDNEYVGGRRARERLSAPIFTRKRKNFPTDYPSDDRRTVDLRYHLENRKQTNGGSPRQFVRRHNNNNNSPHLQRFGYENRSGSRRQQQQQHQPTWRPQRKSIEESVDLLNEDSWDRGGGGGYRKNRHYNNNNNSNVRGGGQDMNVENYISSEGGSGVPWKRRLGERFTRPKTLAEIREEKDKVIGGSTTTTKTMMVREDFEAPKPLSEILKDKNRLASVVEVKDGGNGNGNGNGSR